MLLDAVVSSALCLLKLWWHRHRGGVLSAQRQAGLRLQLSACDGVDSFWNGGAIRVMAATPALLV